MLYIYVSCSSSLSRGDNINAFSVSGELLPKQQIPISSDTVTGYIGTNGNSWMTLQVARSSSQNFGCCTCFYIQFSISQVSVTVTPYLSNVPNTSVFDCVAYPALRLCHLEATIPSRGKAYGQGTRFTMANVDENYLPQRNVDLNCSCDGNIIPACGLWADGQIVFTAKTGTTSATASVTISGTWRY